MDVGVVLPSGVPGVDGRVVVEWARQADAGPFSAVGVADRIHYDSLDIMMTLAAAAAVTSRVRIVANIVLSPLRHTAWLAKEIGTLASLAPGRVSLGVGVGARRQDYDALGLDWSRRGRVLDEQLAHLVTRKAVLDPQEIGPGTGELELLIGGASKPALARLVRYGHGYISGGIKPEFFSAEAAASLAAWQGAGRPGRPRLIAGGWFCSCEDTDDEASAWLGSYLQQGGPPGFVNAGIARGKDGVVAQIRAFREAGADEVILFPCTAAISELEWLAGIVADLPEIPVGEPRFPSAPPRFDPFATVLGTNGVRVGPPPA